MAWGKVALGIVALVFVGSPLAAQEWTRFRGPNGSGVVPHLDFPNQLAESDFRWKTRLPGEGHSSPVVWGNRVFLLSADRDTAMRFVVALDTASGKIVWQREFAAGTSHLHTKSSYASCTPAVDARHVYVSWADDKQTRLLALSHQGETVWEADLGPWVSQHGFGTSPMLYGDMVIVSLMQLGNSGKADRPHGNSRLVALDSSTGQLRWETPRESDVAAYGVPCLYTAADGQELLICSSSAHGIAAHDPATGQQVWAHQVFNMRTVSSPVLAGPYILGSSGSGGGGNTVSALDPNGGQPKLAWRMERQASYVPCPVTCEDKVFIWYDKGIVSCLDIASGQVLGQKRIGGNFFGSPIRVGDRLLAISEEGDLVVVSADVELNVLGRSPLGEGSQSTPAVAGGILYLRTYSHLIAVGG